MAKFGLTALPSTRFTTNLHFKDERKKALWAGLASHSFLRMEEGLSSSFGLVLGEAAHAVG